MYSEPRLWEVRGNEVSSNLWDLLTGLVSLEPWAALPLCNLRWF